jgi:ssDNA-binding Zn-finger/Zn-ribbon topoisomerase 1
MLKEITFKYDYTDIMRALRPFSSRPVTEEEWKNLSPRYISYYEKNSKISYPYTKLNSKKSTNNLNQKKSDDNQNDNYSPDEIICMINPDADIPVKIYVYTGIRRGSDIILDSIVLRAFDSKSDFNHPINEVTLSNNAKTHILERLQKNIFKLIKEIKKDIKQCPEEGCDGLIVEKYSTKTQSTFWACNRYPKCEYIDKEKSKKENNGVKPGPYDKICPECGKKMLKRIAKKGIVIGQEFWGCSAYPTCKHTENI